MQRRWSWLLAAGLCACSSPQRPQSAGAYRFACEPSDARLVVDEEDVGPCALWSSRWLGLTAGVHRVRVQREGWLPHELELRPAGARETVSVRLRREPD